MKAAGRHTLRFTGRVGTDRLKAGRYTVTVDATGTGGSATRELHFTLA